MLHDGIECGGQVAQVGGERAGLLRRPDADDVRIRMVSGSREGGGRLEPPGDDLLGDRGRQTRLAKRRLLSVDLGYDNLVVIDHEDVMAQPGQ